MGGNLAKTPLLAILYASFMSFAAVFIPYSQGYSQALDGFVMPVMGNLLLIVYGLWIALTAAVFLSSVRVKGVLVGLFTLSLIGIQWLPPYLQQLLFGQPTGVMTRLDTVLHMALGAASTILLMVLCLLLFRLPEQGGAGCAVKRLGLLVRLLALSFIFMILYFVTWYFLAWRVDAVRAYYSPGVADNGFAAALIDMVLHNARMMPFALLQGLLYAAFSLPLLFSLAGKRVLYMAVTVMLFLSGALWQLVPNPVVPQAVRMAQLLQDGAQMLVYGLLSAVILYTAVRKVDTAPAATQTLAETPVSARKAGARAVARK